MATLERIRSKGVFLLVVIGLAMLAFIIGDFLNSSSSFFNRDRSYIGVIDDEPVKYEDYQQQIDQFSDFYKVEYNTSTIDERTSESIRQSVWQTILNDRLVNYDAEKIGLVVNDNEMNEALLGENPDASIQSLGVFADPQTGRFSHERLIGLVNQLNEEPTDPSQMEQYNLLKNYWAYCRTFVKSSKLSQKYLALLQKGISTTTLEAKLAYDSKSATSDVLYVEKPFASIADEKAPVSDKELKQRYEQEKERFVINEDQRNLKVCVIENKPTPEDFKTAEDWIKKLQPEFTTTPDIAAFVNSNSNTYTDEALPEGMIDPDFRAFAFSSSTGAVFGPQLFGNTYKMARVVQGNILQADTITLRYMGVQRANAAATTKTADSIMNLVKGGQDFATVAGSQEVTMTTYNNQPNKELVALCLQHNAGDLFKYLPGNGAEFIVQLNKKSAPKKMVKLAVINSEVRPSKLTTSNNYNAAKSFAAAARENYKNFEQLAGKSGYSVQPLNGVTAIQSRLFNLENSRDIVRWAFKEDNDVNAVSDVYECGDYFVVATITAANEKGYLTLDNDVVMNNIRTLVLNDKKAALINKDMEGVASLDALAAKLNLPIDSANQVNFTSSTFGKAGYEPAVIATAALAPQGKLTGPVKGERGMFVMQVNNKTVQSAPFIAAAEKQAITTQSLYGVYRALEAIADKVEVEDRRANFY